MNRCDAGRASAARSFAGIMAALAVTAISAGTATAAAEPGATAAAAAWRVDFDPSAADAQDPAPAAAPAAPTFWQSIEFTGFVDGYYEWAFNKSPLQLRNFDVNHNSFSLNYAELAIIKAVTDTSRGGFRVDFGAGDTADMVNAYEPGGTDYLKYVQQAYVSYLVPVGKGLTVDFGKFVTPHGAEVIETKDNYNYSRGLLFALAIPYYHAGARLGYTVSDKVALTGYIVNGWNSVRDNNSDKTVGVGVATKPTSALAINANYMVGREQAADADGGMRSLFDIVAIYTATPKLSVLANVDYGHDKVVDDGVDWYAVALRAKYQATDKWAFSPRYEIFKDADGFATGTSQTLQEVTLTGEYKATGGLLARVEFRTDFSGEDYFTKSNDKMVSSQPSIAIGLIYAFSSKTP